MCVSWVCDSRSDKENVGDAVGEIGASGFAQTPPRLCDAVCEICASGFAQTPPLLCAAATDAVSSHCVSAAAAASNTLIASLSRAKVSQWRSSASGSVACGCGCGVVVAAAGCGCGVVVAAAGCGCGCGLVGAADGRRVGVLGTRIPAGVGVAPLNAATSRASLLAASTAPAVWRPEDVGAVAPPAGGDGIGDFPAGDGGLAAAGAISLAGGGIVGCLGPIEAWELAEALLANGLLPIAAFALALIAVGMLEACFGAACGSTVGSSCGRGWWASTASSKVIELSSVSKASAASRSNTTPIGPGGCGG